MKKLSIVILVAFLTSMFTLVVANKYMNHHVSFLADQASNPSQNANAHFTDFTEPSATADGGSYVNLEDAADKASKVVVHVKTEKKAMNVQNQNPFGGMDPFEQFFGRGGSPFMQQQPQAGSGSGVIISNDGYIVTNNHVVDGADEVTVVLNSKKSLKAKVVGKDASTDLAVLKVEETNLPFIEFGNSDDVRLGQWVLAVGYPLSLETTVTAGIVSAKYRNIGINQQKSGGNAIESFIQTDAAVNPGNSGGALVNARGQLIGINSAIASPTGSYAGYSFAIPSNIVRKVTNDFMKYGNVQRAYLGVAYLDPQNTTPDKISKLGLDKVEGVYIDQVMKDGSAEDAGLKPADIITKIGTKDIKNAPQMLEQVAQYRPGDKTTITYLRAGVSKTSDLTFKNKIGNTDVVKNDVNNSMGATFKALSKAECRQYGITGGVQITNIESSGLLARSRVRKMFIITQINGTSIASEEDLNKVFESEDSDFQIGGIYPGMQGVYYYIVKNDN